MFAIPVQLVGACLLAACGSGGTGPDLSGTVPPIPPVPPVPLEIVVTDLLVDPGPTPGSVRLTFTAPGEPGDAAADAYVVRTSRRQIDADTLAGATPWPNSHTPGAPGTTEVLTLTGLEPGRTLQFSVQPVYGTTTAPLGTAAGGRVAGSDIPAVPAGAIQIAGPATLSQSGATYLLTQDVTTSGTAFNITTPNVTLDLGGHTVTYGTGGSTSHGVTAQHLGGSGRIVVRNGRLVRGAGSGTASHGVFLWEVDDVRVSYLDVTVSGTDAMGIWVTSAGDDVRVDHCVVACRTSVVSNRHYPGVSGIFVEDARGAVEVDQNLVTASPQWGIRVDAPSTTGDALVHHNRVQGTKALVANGYMLGMAKPGLDVFENVVEGESRGIHLNGIDGASRNVHVHDNHVETQDQTNPEYPTKHWTHGIKIEGAPGCLVERNDVTGLADPGHSEVRALDVHVGDADGIVVRDNRITARSVTSAEDAIAVWWTYGSNTAPNDIVVRHNVFTATDTMVLRFWDAGVGGLFRDNVYLRDLSQGGGHPFRFEYFGNADTLPSLGHRFLDAWTAENVLDVEQWASPAAYESTREWTLTVRVTDGATPVPGASVAVRTSGGSTALSGTTNAEGWVRGAVLGTRVTNGPSFASPGPYTVSVTTAGHPTWSGAFPVTRTTAVHVDVGAASGSLDTTAPAAPDAVRAHPLSASRAVVVWEPPADVPAVARYLVDLDGRPWAVTDAPGVFLGGLEAATTYVATVRAVDAGGNASAPTAGVAFTTRPEDRGP